MSSLLSNARRLLLLCGTLPALAVAVCALYRPAFVNRIDDGVYDYSLRWAGTTAADRRIVIVDIDERSLARYGQWPWRRDTVAQLIAGLRDYGAAVVALDIMFPEGDRSGPEADKVFAATLRQGGVVLGYGLTFDGAPRGEDGCVLHPMPLPVVQPGADARDEAPVFAASGAVCNIPVLARAAGASGFLNAAPDADGILRRAPVLAALGETLYPSLALAAVGAFTGNPPTILRVANDNSSSLVRNAGAVPLDGKGNLLLRFRGRKKTFRYVSAADVLDARLPPDGLRDALVLVGTTALGTREVVATPFDTLFVGVEVQATVVDNLLTGDYLHRPEDQRLIESALTLASGVGVAGLVAMRGLALGTAIGCGALAGFWVFTVWLLEAHGTIVSPLFPTIGWLAAFAVLSLARFLMERSRANNAGRESTAARTLMIQALLSLTEVRDAETGRHSRRTQEYTKLLAEELARHPRFRSFLTPERIELLSSLAPLHDIGKVGVRDSILNKPGDLTPEELVEMRRHTIYGHDVILNAERKAAVRDEAVLSLAKEIVYTHHERWDGTGYPQGLRGEKIPIAGRILAVVDVYDAVTARSLYRPPMPHEAAITFIVSGQGTHFDPAVVDALVRVAPAFRSLSVQPMVESIPA